MLGGCQPAPQRSRRAGTQPGPDLLGQRVRPLTLPHIREAEKTQRLLSGRRLFSLHSALRAAPSPGQWRERDRGSLSPQGQSPGRCSPVLPAPTPAFLPGSQTADGKRVARGCPQAWGPSLPTTSSSCTPPRLPRAQRSPAAPIPSGLGAGRLLLPSPPAVGLPLSPELADRAGPRFLRRTKETDFFNFCFPFKGKEKPTQKNRRESG